MKGKTLEMKKLLLFVSLALLAAMPAWSQTTDEVPRIDLFGGYTHQTGDVGLNGWDVGATLRASQYIGVAADISGAYGSNSILGIKFNSHQYNFLFGPRIFIPLNEHPQWKPFGELLLGFAHLSQSVNIPGLAPSLSDTSFAWALGGGIDYQVNDRFRVRPFEIDLLHSNFNGVGSNRAKITLGVIYQFGGLQ